MLASGGGSNPKPPVASPLSRVGGTAPIVLWDRRPARSDNMGVNSVQSLTRSRPSVYELTKTAVEFPVEFDVIYIYINNIVCSR